jgi:hypothetical protein
MGRQKEPVTAAVRVLRAAGVAFEGHPYRYVPAGGTAQFAGEHGVDEHTVIKTLIMEDDQRQPLIVLMHGDRQVSLRELARQIGARQVQALRADGRGPAFGLPGWRHLALRDAPTDAGLLRIQHQRSAADLRERRQARLHHFAGHDRVAARAATDAGPGGAAGTLTAPVWTAFRRWRRACQGAGWLSRMGVPQLLRGTR